MKQITAILAACLIALTGCGGNFEGMNADMAPGMEDMLVSEIMSKAEEQLEEYDEADYDDAGSYENTKNVATAKIPSKIIKEGNASIEVGEYAAVMVQVKAVIEKYEGYIANEDEENNHYRTSNSLVIKVLNDRFEEALNELTALGDKVDYKRVNADDVTEEFVDIQARIKTKRAVEQRYVEILQQAKTIDEILEVEDHLRVIREELESIEGRLKYLDERVKYSTIHLTVYQTYDYASTPYSPDFGDKMGDAFGGGWEGFLMVLVGIVYLWPFVLLLIVLLFLLRRWRKKRRARKAAATKPPYYHAQS